jgi:hypothetical protein
MTVPFLSLYTQTHIYTYCDVPPGRPDDKTCITSQRLAIPRQQSVGNRCPGNESLTVGFPSLQTNCLRETRIPEATRDSLHSSGRN